MICRVPACAKCGSRGSCSVALNVIVFVELRGRYHHTTFTNPHTSVFILACASVPHFKPKPLESSRSLFARSRLSGTSEYKPTPKFASSVQDICQTTKRKERGPRVFLTKSHPVQARSRSKRSQIPSEASEISRSSKTLYNAIEGAPLLRH